MLFCRNIDHQDFVTAELLFPTVWMTLQANPADSAANVGSVFTRYKSCPKIQIIKNKVDKLKFTVNHFVFVENVQNQITTIDRINKQVHTIITTSVK